MESIFMKQKTKNSRTNKPHEFVQQRLGLNETFQKLSVHYTWKNIRQQYINNKLKIIAPIWNDEFELPDGCNSVSNVQDYLEYIMKKYEILTDNSAIHIYINRTNNRLLFKIKGEHQPELKTPEIMKLFGSTKTFNRQNKEWRSHTNS